MKKIFSLLIILCFFISTNARHIPENTAKEVAKNFYLATDKGNALGQNMVLTLAHKEKATVQVSVTQENVLFYIFNVNFTEGFVIVTADDNVQPILGYSETNFFDPNDVPINMVKWLEGYKKEAEYIVANGVLADNIIEQKWRTLKDGSYAVTNRTLMSVNPLLTTTWNQNPYYNSMCPNGTVTGCVATAMAQVMKYWSHPAQGTGFHSYNENDFGTLSANFGGTTYNWAAMPNSISSNNAAIGTLMYHCGVSVDMNYGYASAGGSGAYVISAASPVTHCSEYAFENYFGYSTNLQGVQRSNYTETAWINLMKAELDAGRPILHAGFGSNGGHAFVCDGYDNNNYFHFNWGWGGSSDGYFWNDALNPGSLGTGGGSGGFNNGQQIIIGVQPAGGGTGSASSMSLYDNVIATPNPVTYGQAVSVSTNIWNTSSSTFYGEITAALFDANYNFVEHIQTLNETNGLSANFVYSNNLNFSSSGLSATPGNYYVGIFVKPTGGNWIQVSDGNYQNMVPLTINGASNNIEMYGALAVTPDPIVENEPFSVWLDIANTGTSNFDGKVSIDLHQLDGTWIQQIDEKDNLSLGSNFHFTNGLTYNSTGLGVDPGTYLIAVWEQQTGGSWELIEGSASYPNPVNITITQQSLQGDIYENNDLESSAYTLPLTFSGNSTSKFTTGSNTHIGTDVDFYKIHLPAGYDYSIDPRLHDSYSSGNGQSYDNDVLWSYKVGSGNWSGTYDDVLTTNNITVNGGTTVYFQIASYFQGTTGTYLFDIDLSRSPASSTENVLDENAISVYPNPVQDVLTLNLTEDIDVETITFYSVSGQEVSFKTIENNQKNIDVSDLPNGVYLVTVTTNNGVWNGKVIVNR